MALIAGTVIQFTDGTNGVVRSMIGEGGQGEVYKIDYKGETKVLKWMKSHPGPKVAKCIHDNILRKATIPDYFQWPIAVCDNHMGFGYVMDLVDTSEYAEFKDFIYRAEKNHFENFSVAVTACLNLCLAFKKLHAHGLAYFDMNEGNFFFNPKTGDVLIIDTDNIAPAGHVETNILGTMGYMAPELVAFEIPEGVSGADVIKYIPRPNRYTDYCSLAFVLFRMIFIDHPLEGEVLDLYPCMTPRVQRYIYGENPVFIYDPNNSENRPIEELSPTVVHRWNNCVPSFVKDAFIRAFSYENLHKPNKRLMESEWIKIFTRWRAQLCPCPSCGKETYLDYSNKGKCSKCNGTSPMGWMKIGSETNVIPLVKGVKLYGSQIGVDGAHFNVIAQIGRSKATGGLLIKNTSSYEWSVQSVAAGSQQIIRPGEFVQIFDKMTIKFSNISEAKVRLM